MFKLLAMHADMAFLIVLVGIAVAAFITSRLGELPAKGWAFVLAAGASVVGWQILRRQRTAIIKTEITKITDRIEERKSELKQQKTDYEHADSTVTQGQAALEEARLNYQREGLLINAKTQEQREEILRLPANKLREKAALEL